MYTFCSFLQEVLKKACKIDVYRDLIELEDKVPSWKASSNLEIMKSLSALAKAILESKSKLLDWITSRVVLVLPESYSNVIPSLAISAAFNWDSVAINTLSDDWYLDHALVVSVPTLFSASSANNKDLCFFKDDFLIEEIFSPPLIIGQVIVALTVSWSSSSIVEL